MHHIEGTRAWVGVGVLSHFSSVLAEAVDFGALQGVATCARETEDKSELKEKSFASGREGRCVVGR
jgi:hypothetical protein